jgi:two-component system response regulator HydG
MNLESRILVVEDEPNMRAHLQTALEADGYSVSLAQDGQQGISRFKETRYDLVLCDMAMPGKDGFEVLDFAHGHRPDVPFVMITAFGTINMAVEAMKRGACDFLPKPFKNEEIRATVRRALESRSSTIGPASPAKAISLIARSRQMQEVIELVTILAPNTATVLIQGESGVGKELVARAIHAGGPRRGAPFLAIDCGAVPESLLESELFGYVKGAFTGALTNKRGLFEEASHGTVLLDEIGNTSLAFQAKLLRVLQQNEIRPVGSNHCIPVDVRIIAATNRDLKQLVERGLFRDDLYYRLAVVPVMIPPLRDRPDDIPVLAEHFIRKAGLKHGTPARRISPEAMEALLRYPWPGNVREMENVIERAVIFEYGEEIRLESLPPEIRSGCDAETLRHVMGGSLRTATQTVQAEIEKDRIQAALRLAGGNKTKAARILNVSRVTLYQKIREYRLETNCLQDPSEPAQPS